MEQLAEARPGAMRSPGAMAVAVMVLAGTANFLGFNLPRPVLPAIQAALAHGPGDQVLVKLIMTALVAGLILGAPVASIALDRISYRIVLLGSALLFVAAGTAGYVLDDLRLLVASRFVTGAAGAVLNITAITMAGALFDPVSRGRWVGAVSAAGSLSSIIASPLAGLAGSVSWHLPFLLHLVILPIALCAPFLAGDLRTRTAGEEAGTVTRFPRYILLLSMVVGLLLTLPGIYFAFRMRDVGIVSAAAIGSLFLANTVPETIAGAAYGFIRRRIGAYGIFAMAFALAAAGMALVATMPAGAGLILGLALYGPGNALMNANTMNIAAGYGAQRSKVVALVQACYCVASVAGVVLLEAAFGRGGAAAQPLLAMAGLAVLGAAYYGGRQLRLLARGKPGLLAASSP